jgi:hypothetical protein
MFAGVVGVSFHANGAHEVIGLGWEALFLSSVEMVGSIEEWCIHAVVS